MKKYRVNESEHFNLYSMHDKLKCIEIDMQEAPAHTTYTDLLLLICLFIESLNDFIRFLHYTLRFAQKQAIFRKICKNLFK